MPTYEKIDNNTFVEVSENRKTLKRADLIRRREELKAAYEALGNPPSNAELLAYARQTHPYYVQKNMIQGQWQEIRDLIIYLQNL